MEAVRKIPEVKIPLNAPKECHRRKSSKDENELESEPYRNIFVRDRDRILYSTEFRRLSGKTQIFLATSDDQVRTRLTHTLEVSQISRVAAKNLELNEDLCEAIALAHDVGHTPFGHAGEKALNHIMNGCYHIADCQSDMDRIDKGFKHNLQGLRVTTDLERLYKRVGLNLSNFTLWGIKNHTGSSYAFCPLFLEQNCYLTENISECVTANDLCLDFYSQYDQFLKMKVKDKKSDEYIDEEAWSFEANIVKMADEIAQRHHDIVDSLLLKIIGPGELIEQLQECFGDFKKERDDEILIEKEDTEIFAELKNHENDLDMFRPFISKFIVNFLNKNLIVNSARNMNSFIKKHNITNRENFIDFYSKSNVTISNEIVSFSAEFQKKEKFLHQFLKNRILNSFEVQRMDGKGSYIIRKLFKAYLANPRQLHDATIVFIFRLFEGWSEDWKTISPKEVGNFRARIDDPKNKSMKKFQVALLRGIADHVAGMTDNFAILEYERLYGVNYR